MVDVSGNVNLCCVGYIGQTVGNLADGTFEEAWNSPIAQDIRRSILDGSYSYCSHTCPYLNGDRVGRVYEKSEVTNPEHRYVIENNLLVIPRGPKEVLPAYDATCNLACPGCRTDFVVARGEERARVEQIHETVFGEALTHAECLVLSGQGDPFASPLYREVLENFDTKQWPGLRLVLITNALLFTPRNWDAIASAHPAISLIQVSINAATKETFEYVQRGGQWERFLKNLAFVKSLREQNAFPYLRLSFYVSALNFREMKAAIELAKEHAADQIDFTLLEQGMVYSDEEYALLAIQREAHPQHGEFLEYLNDEIFRDPVVAVGNLLGWFPKNFFMNASTSTFPLGEVRDLASLGAYLESEAIAVYTVEGGLNEIKKTFAEICSTESESGMSPVAVLADLLSSNPEQAEKQFQHFMSIERPTGFQHSYAQEVDQRVRAIALGIRAGLPLKQQLRFQKLSPAHLLSIQTGYDPFGAAVHRLIGLAQERTVC